MSTYTSVRKQSEQMQKFVANCKTEAQLFTKLLDTKPEFLNFLNYPWIDRVQVEQRIKGQFDRLVIHGFPDRAQRLRYLVNVLKKKWGKKPEKTSALLTFLLDLSESYPLTPEIHDSGLIFSEETEDDVSTVVSEGELLQPDELEAEAEAKKFKELIVKELQLAIQGDNDGETLQYSGSGDDEELSDWESEGSDEDVSLQFLAEEAERTEVNRTVGNFGKVGRRSATIHDFTIRARKEDIPVHLDPQLIRVAQSRYWHTLEQEAYKIIHSSIRKVDPVSLVEIGQPVISSLYVFRARFGEWWEWQNPSSTTNLSIILENDIIRELLWQFCSPSCAPESTVVFGPDFKFKPELMLRSLTKSALNTLMKDFSLALQRLNEMKRFIVASSVGADAQGRAYAGGLALILNSTLAPKMHELEVELRNRSADAPTTLVRLRLRLRKTLKLIEAFWRVHSEIFRVNTATKTQTHIFSKLEHILTHWIWPSPKIYGLALYLYFQVFKAFIQEILIQPLHNGSGNNQFFSRAKGLSINDPEFFDNCVTLNQESSVAGEIPLAPEWTYDVIPQLLHILKILAMFQAIGNNDNNGPKISKLMPKTLDEVVDKVVNALGIGTEVDRLGQESISSPEAEAYRSPGFKSLNLSPNAKAYSYNPRQEFLRHCQNQSLPSTVGQQDLIQRSFLRLLEPACPVPVLPPKTLLENLSNLSSIPKLKIVQAASKVFLSYLGPISNTLNSHLEYLVSKYRVQHALELIEEILYGNREDFVFDVLKLTKSGTEMQKSSTSTSTLSEFLQDELNLKFQELIAKYYDDLKVECGGLFTIDYVHDDHLELGFDLRLSVHFPLNLILTTPKIKQISRISTQLWRIAKAWWWVHDLKMTESGAYGNMSLGGVSHLGRIMLIKYWTLSLISSVRSFVMLEKSSARDTEALHSMLSHPIIDRIVIRSLGKAAKCIGTKWTHPGGPTWIQLGKIEQILIGVLDGISGSLKFSFVYRLGSYLPADVSIIQDSRDQNQNPPGSAPGVHPHGQTMSTDTLLRTLSETLVLASSSATSLAHLLNQ